MKKGLHFSRIEITDSTPRDHPFDKLMEDTLEDLSNRLSEDTEHMILHHLETFIYYVTWVRRYEWHELYKLKPKELVNEYKEWYIQTSKDISEGKMVSDVL